MTTGTKDKLLSAAKRRYKECHIEELNATFRIQSLNGREISKFAAKFTSGNVDENSIDQLASLLAMTLVDDDGNLLITSPEEQAQLADLEFSVLVKLANAAQVHNRLTEEADQVIAKN